jgi:hypothetical protein
MFSVEWNRIIHQRAAMPPSSIPKGLNRPAQGWTESARAYPGMDEFNFLNPERVEYPEACEQATTLSGLLWLFVFTQVSSFPRLRCATARQVANLG